MSDLEVRSGELLALLGPSGSGKTTLLRIIAGLDWPDEGQVQFDGEDALSRTAAERHVGFVFQHYALFRHMTVFENVAFGLRAKPRKQRPGEAEIRRRVEELLDLVQLGWLAPSAIRRSSRAASASALRSPGRSPSSRACCLLDEPFGSLDAKVRKELRRWLRNLHKEIHVTSIFVTHDQEEALEVADRIVVMDKGRIEQTGTPQQVYDQPRTPFVHEFIGESIVLPVVVRGSEVQFAGRPIGVDPQGIARRRGDFVRAAIPYDDLAGAGRRRFQRRHQTRPRHRRGAARRNRARRRTDRKPSSRSMRRARQQWRVGQAVGLRPEQYRLFPNRTDA